MGRRNRAEAPHVVGGRGHALPEKVLHQGGRPAHKLDAKRKLHTLLGQRLDALQRPLPNNLPAEYGVRNLPLQVELLPLAGHARAIQRHRRIQKRHRRVLVEKPPRRQFHIRVRPHGEFHRRIRPRERRRHAHGGEPPHFARREILALGAEFGLADENPHRRGGALCRADDGGLFRQPARLQLDISVRGQNFHPVLLRHTQYGRGAPGFGARRHEPLCRRRKNIHGRKRHAKARRARAFAFQRGRKNIFAQDKRLPRVSFCGVH